MNSSIKQNVKSFRSLLTAPLITVALLFAGAAPVLADVLPPNSSTPPYNKTYSQWAGDWWGWFMELPLTNSAGFVHPGIDAGQAAFDVTEGQSGYVWFLAAPFGTVQRTATIPSGKALFFAILNAEWSSLEGPGPVCANVSDASCQLANATYFADHIVDLSCEIDGVAVQDISSFRVQNGQINFVAPTPWIFGSTGGHGTSSGDGYFVFLTPFAAGQHTIHFGGAIQFTKKADGFRFFLPLDMTYNVTVQ